MIQSAKDNRGIAGPVVLMFITAMGAAWMAYSWLFPQDIITLIVLFIYIPTVGVIAGLLYKKLKQKV